ncbi:slit -like protein [Brachionus plicatilis]|uniref:Slit-like protein n=1 Tax=Brachionus plicatilis TaxID=10195 RepID=A0A3M7QNE6_BRAPC|nr:slit -like protein [Brachionus plicatilis]
MMILKIYLTILIYRISLACPFNQCKQYDHENDPRPMCICGLGEIRFKFESNSSSLVKKMSVLQIWNFATVPIKVFSGLEIRELILTNSPVRVLRNGIFQNISKLFVIELSNMPFLNEIKKGPLWLFANRLSELRIKNLPSLANFELDSFKNLLILDISSSTMKNLTLTSSTNLALVRIQTSDIDNLKISQLPSLSDLYIQNNIIRQLQVKNLSALNYLSLESNDLKSTPHMTDLNSLKTLILDNNGLDDSIAEFLSQIKSLENLSAKKNFIKNTNFLKSLNSIQNVVLSGNLIENFDPILANGWKFLDLESNLIENDLTFDSSSLLILNLNKNRIRNLFLKNLNYLQSVYLGSNLFARIQISNCSALKSLEVVNSNLSLFHLENLVSLEYLLVKNLSWEVLIIENLPSLVLLDLYGPGAVNFLSNFSSSSVQGLVVKDSGLKDIYHEIFSKFNNIYAINFGQNNLTIINNSSLFYGKFIELAHNQIGQIENMDFFISFNFHVDLSFNLLGNLELRGNVNSAIEELLLAGNDIENFEISDHPDLSALNLSHNRIAEFKAQNLPNLKILDLSFNKIRVLNVTDEIDINLYHLNISSNNLSFFNFEKFTNLISLVARDNLFTSVDFESFSLNELDISSNRISNISFLANFPLLKYLNLSGNLISEIEENAFDKNLELESIDLSNNYLSRIPSVDRLIFISYLSVASQNGRLKYVHDYAFSNQHGNYLTIDMRGNRFKSFSNRMLCRKDKNKVTISSIQIDCGLRIRKCFYQNLEMFLSDECQVKRYKNHCNQRSRFVFYEPISQSCPHDSKIN